MEAIPSDWTMKDGPVEKYGCVLYCKENSRHRSVARCHIVPEAWCGSFLSGREEGPQPPRVKLRGEDKVIAPLVALCQELGLVSYSPMRAQ